MTKNSKDLLFSTLALCLMLDGDYFNQPMDAYDWLEDTSNHSNKKAEDITNEVPVLY